jgi:hypothetical protein
MAWFTVVRRSRIAGAPLAARMGFPSAPTSGILRRSRSLTAAGTPPENDYDVLEDGRRIGRIYKTNHLPGAEQWVWGNGLFPNSTSDRGLAPTFEEAMAAFKAALFMAPPVGPETPAP